MITFAEGQHGKPLRSVEEIRQSYDRQASESYVKKLRNPFFEKYGREVGRTLANLKPKSLLDVGTGDGYTLSYALEECRIPVVVGVDVSMERLRIAESILGPRNVTFQQMDLFNLSFGDDSFDVVMTSHAIEPNGGKELEAVRELTRVARRYVLMLEPDYYAATEDGKKRMERLNYCTDLWEACVDIEAGSKGKLSFSSAPFSLSGNALNPSGCFLICKVGNA
jgi:ubiquinone/menaquinone biosynthesis C-methylase UbiE